ncbi:hypothetical protein [Pseudonocardia sp.]|nr:hypothetical protein [Pseudonocardia sp.]
MSTEDSRKLVHRRLDEIWNRADRAVVDELYAADHVNPRPRHRRW